MTNPVPAPFLGFLRAGLAQGGFGTDDVLAALLPLFRQVEGWHALGRVAPLEGVGQILIVEQRHLAFPEDASLTPRIQRAALAALQAPADLAVEILNDSGEEAEAVPPPKSAGEPLPGEAAFPPPRPVFLAGYRGWEHAVGHHDPLTDIHSLGLLLASLAAGLDFSDPAEVERFVHHRSDLAALQPRMHPVVASVIGQMTELNRHRRAPDLAGIIARLATYRDQPSPLDFARIDGFREAGSGGRRRLIQCRLRDRLFELSRRNRLLYFKPSQQSLNLTVASVPPLLDYRNLCREQLFLWHPELAAALADGGPLSLGKYLRFEEAPYLPGALDRLIADARRDRAEYGFAQLRLVLCFFRWHNLKEAPEERIHSPLLLLPVELSRRKGVRDSYLLDPTSHEAEVNPVLRQQLRELYRLELPELIDLRTTSLEEFHARLQDRIQATEPGVVLRRIDRPQLRRIQERARQRVEHFRRRHPGLQPDPGGTPVPPLAESPDPGASASAGPAAEGLIQAVEEGDGSDPYAWDFDLCSLTLGNFNYRKMTLVQDYQRLIETDLESRAFDTVFSVCPRPVEQPNPSLPQPGDQYLVVPGDATQSAAVARSRTGASYIIQGPPGTGKSQTITNLIADHVARGQRVLFVCEKRAAIDVVFHRLRQQGLAELCCLIHDSQTDKKAFIQNLKQTYERCLSEADPDPEVESSRQAVVEGIRKELQALAEFSSAMQQPQASTGLPVRALLERGVALGRPPEALSPELEALLPDYPAWLAHGATLTRLQSGLAELGQDLCFARHPLRWLGHDILLADRPATRLLQRLEEAERWVGEITRALNVTGLPTASRDTFAELAALVDFAVRALPVARSGLLGALRQGAEAEAFATRTALLDQRAKAAEVARTAAEGWREPLSPADTEAALALAQGFEGSVFRWFQPAFWRLRSQLRQRYDFARHAVEPGWGRILSELAERHRTEAAWQSARDEIRQQWQTEDEAALRAQVVALRSDPRTSQPPVATLLATPQAAGSHGATLLSGLAGLQAPWAELETVLRSLLHTHIEYSFPRLTEIFASLREQADTLDELAPVLAEVAALPPELARALREAHLPLPNWESAIAQRSLEQVWRKDRTLARFDSRSLERRRETLGRQHAEWLDLNARAVRSIVRRRFLEHVALAGQAAGLLTPEQKAFKRAYTAGRRELEHEFGKTMRYKSIRDLAAGESGLVLRDLKPVWLMSPLSVSDTLPLDPGQFDVVIFDEASQIPLEEAVPALYRSHQTIVVGDEMQLPPTTFFASAREEGDRLVVEEDGERIEVGLDADSFLTQAATNLPSTLLAWHYRSRYEALISFSNAACYGGQLFTVPDRRRPTSGLGPIVATQAESGATAVEALLARSLSFHYQQHAVYAARRNPGEAAYIAELVRSLLRRGTGLSLGVVAFSQAQQAEIEEALERLAETDETFAGKLEAEYVRESNDQFCGLFVKNLENVQGDERDIIIMSVCYGRDAAGRMLMNFGPINQRGGEKRLNVIYSRARQHLAVVTSIRHAEITNDFNDGAHSLKRFLEYAELVSAGDATRSRRVLDALNPPGRGTSAMSAVADPVVRALAEALRSRGHAVDLGVGQSRFRCDLAVQDATGEGYRLGILMDTATHYANPDLLDRYLLQPGILTAFGWRCMVVLTKDWYLQPDEVLARIEKHLRLSGGPDSAKPGLVSG